MPVRAVRCSPHERAGRMTTDLRVDRVRVLPLTLPIDGPLRYTQGQVGAFQRIVVELTSSDGHVGYGECRGDRLRHTLLSDLAPGLVGLDPYKLESLRWRIAPQGLVELFSGTVAVQAYSAIEVACLDLIGKATSRPVTDLLGGGVREDVEIAGYLYYVGGVSDDEAEDRLLASAHASWPGTGSAPSSTSAASWTRTPRSAPCSGCGRSSPATGCASTPTARGA
ncbi:hypothetical protein BJF90_44535 [Pseudonocardia sp. CNS-004]|nr:hypothetical protein BJF90_44535 [Pseudonocardia sp. CNS-004]